MSKSLQIFFHSSLFLFNHKSGIICLPYIFASKGKKKLCWAIFKNMYYHYQYYYYYDCCNTAARKGSSLYKTEWKQTI